MKSILLRSVLQTFSVPGLDAVSRALGWTIIVLVLLTGLAITANAYFLSTFTEEFIGYLIFHGAQIVALMISLIFSSYILAPTSVLYGLLFQDRVARAVERKDYPCDAPGRAVFGARPFVRALRSCIGTVVIGIVSLPLAAFGTPLLGIVFYVLAAGALLGRDQFVSVACRYVPVGEARALRRRNAWRVYTAGVAIAGTMMVPVLNLMMPVFATIVMIHVYKSLHPVIASAELLPRAA